ncbi:hypothetical protein GWK41_02320 [Persephonella atlantica]|uniref:Uncharacterized protein n=1 Tax=Persephonella atlantica TaxID=2699429 RepID=A0ABS1GGL6_9AQUI|nr:hypothetical protein [Persephonella atlantica]MBK3331902.1 hypothetical protein [Persephonella atlantica]
MPVIVTLLIFFLNAFGNTLILSKSGYSTYIQEEEFMLAKGENIIGPITVLPNAVVDAVDIFADNVTINSIIYDRVHENWKKNLLGKYVTVEGEGRIIRGVVVYIGKKFITLDTKKGYVVTTIPEFPSRITSHLRWEELFSPQLTLKVNSPEAMSQTFKIRYPVYGFGWDIYYILTINDGIKQIKGFIKIINNTAVNLKKVSIEINGLKNRRFSEISISPYSFKKVLFIKKRIKNLEQIKGLPEGKVYIYKNGIFVKTTTLRKLSL